MPNSAAKARRTGRGSWLFCLNCPRCAIAHRRLAVAMKVKKSVASWRQTVRCRVPEDSAGVPCAAVPPQSSESLRPARRPSDPKSVGRVQKCWPWIQLKAQRKRYSRDVVLARIHGRCLAFTCRYHFTILDQVSRIHIPRSPIPQFLP